MKLEELTPNRLWEEIKKAKGTYAGVRFDEQTVTSLQKYIKDNDIPNAIAGGKMHCTLLYSTKFLPDYKPLGKIDPPFEGKPKKFEKWESQPDDNGKKSQCLVLTFDCKELVARHKELMAENNAKFDFDEYKPHVTLSYDVGDLDIKDLSLPTQKFVINKEYGEELNVGWKKSNT